MEKCKTEFNKRFSDTKQLLEAQVTKRQKQVININNNIIYVQYTAKGMCSVVIITKFGDVISRVYRNDANTGIVQLCTQWDKALRNLAN